MHCGPIISLSIAHHRQDALCSYRSWIPVNSQQCCTLSKRRHCRQIGKLILEEQDLGDRRYETDYIPPEHMQQCNAVHRRMYIRG